MTTGIDTAKVTQWLVGHVDEMTAPLAFDLITGGRSNMTFAVTDARGRRVVLRRPPMSHVLSTAHDMGREYRVISALAGTPVPVPAALGFCADEQVNGRPFYVMEFVEGYVLRGEAETEATLDQAARRRAGYDLIDVLAAIHQVDVDAVGLGDLARRDGYIERQLRRWFGQFEQSQQQAREVGVYRAVPLVAEVHQMLADRVPAQHGTAIVHGDYRIDNTILSGDGQVQAVLDWELCTLGDPLADVGTLLAYWAEEEPGAQAGEAGAAGPAGAGAAAAGVGAAGGSAASAPVTMVQLGATGLPGFPNRSELASRYSAQSGRDLADIGFYVAFAYWKLACILEGVFVRYAARATGTDASDADALAAGVADRAHRALIALRP